MLHDDDGSVAFLEAAGRALFGEHYLSQVAVDDYVEELDKRKARLVFDAGHSRPS